MQQQTTPAPSPVILAAYTLCREHPDYADGCKACAARRRVVRAELVEQAEDWIRSLP